MRGDRHNFERLLRVAYDLQRRQETLAIASSANNIEVNEPRPGKQLRLDYSLGLVLFILTVLYVIYPPTTKLAAISWITVLIGIAIYPVLHFWQWLLKGNGLRLVLTVATVLGFGIFVALKIWPLFYPSVSLKAMLAPSYNEGEEVAGIKWKASFQDIRIVIANLTEYPLHNLDLTVQAMPQTDDTFVGLGQLSSIEGVKFYPPEWPDMSLTLRGIDGQKYDLNFRDAGHLSFGNHWKMSCPVLSTTDELRLILAAERTRVGFPNKLRIFGTLERVSNDGYQVTKVDQTIAVKR